MSISRVLNSKWGIAALVGIAGYVVFQNAVQPFLGVSNDYEDAPFFEDDEYFEELDQDRRALKSVSIEQLYWNEAVARDPFGPMATISADQAKEAKKIRGQRVRKPILGSSAAQKPKQQAKPVEPEKLPQLSSFIAGDKSRKAILNDQIVSEGDQVDDYLVLAITPEGVLLRHPDGLSNINLKTTP